jgi:hypothetical protein
MDIAQRDLWKQMLDLRIPLTVCAFLPGLYVFAGGSVLRMCYLLILLCAAAGNGVYLYIKVIGRK